MKKLSNWDQISVNEYRDYGDFVQQNRSELLRDAVSWIDPDKMNMSRDQALCLMGAMKVCGFSVDDFAEVMNKSSVNKGTLPKSWDKMTGIGAHGEATEGTIFRYALDSGWKWPAPDGITNSHAPTDYIKKPETIVSSSYEIKICCFLDSVQYKEKPTKIYEIRQRENYSSSDPDILTPMEFAQAVTSGRTFYPAIFDKEVIGYEDNGKPKYYYRAIKQQLFSVDIDNEKLIKDENGKALKTRVDNPLSIDAAIEICKKHGIMPMVVYETFSSKDHRNSETEPYSKFRLVFATDQPVSVQEYGEHGIKAVTNYLINLFGEAADHATVDFARMFFGTDERKSARVYCKFLTAKELVTKALEPLDPDAEESDPPTVTEIFGETNIFDAGDICYQEIPDKDWSIEGVCVQGECALLSGASKSGKSYLSTQAAVNYASGTKWLDTFQCKKGPVLYVNGENEIYDAERRFQLVFRELTIAPDMCERITCVCADGYMKSIQEIKESLKQEIVREGYSLVILDPLYCFYQGSEIDEQDAKGFVAALKEICRETKVTILCVHHHSKGGQAFYSNASSRASGSGMLQRAFSTLLDLSPIKESEQYLQDGQKGYEFSGEPRQAKGFKMNIVFDYPLWKLDTKLALPDNAANRGKTAAARSANGNIQKAEKVKALLPEILETAFKENALHDDLGDYVTVGNIVDLFVAQDIATSERAIERKLDDGAIHGYMRDPHAGQRRKVRRVDFEAAADSVIEGVFPDEWQE